MKEGLEQETKIVALAGKPKTNLVNPNGRIPIWLFACLVSLFIAFLYLTESWGQKASLPRGATQIMSGCPREIGIQPGRTNLGLDKQELGTYCNEAYGFGFDYPKVWGEVELEQASAGDRSVNPVGLNRPDTGAIFVGKFSREPGCGFGAITPDYTYGAEGPLIMSAGWREENGHYYTLWPDSSIRNLVSNRGPDELVPERVIKIASGTGKALILETPIEDFDGTVIDTVLKADINLPGPIFRGIALGCSISPNDNLEKISEERRGVDAMSQSFRYTRASQGP